MSPVAGMRKIIGSIENGRKANLVVLGADYLTAPEDQIEKISVVAAVVDGRIVFGSLKRGCSGSACCED